MKKAVLPILFLISVILFSNLVMSAPPVLQAQTIEKGLIIEVPIIEYIKANETFKFHIHVFNASNGQYMFNDTVSCIIHLYDLNGEHLIEDDMSFDSNGIDFKYDVAGSNFSRTGQQSVLFQCNDSNGGGFIEYPFYVNKLGREITVAESVVYFLLTFAVFFIFMLSLYFVIIIPYSNKRNMKGEVIQIERTKYIKVSLALITYGLLIWFLNLLVAITNYYVVLPMFYGFASMIFNVLMALVYPLFIFYFVWFFWSLFNDWKIHKLIIKFGSAIDRL